MSDNNLPQNDNSVLITSKHRKKIPSSLEDLVLNKVFFRYSSEVHKFLKEAVNDSYIADLSDGPCCFVDLNNVLLNIASDESGEKCFKVRNNSGESYWLLQIDKGVIKKSVKKCDCAVINKYTIAFIEFKANMTTLSPKTMLKEYENAQKQLKSTISLFKEIHGEKLSSLRELSAYICLKKGYPKFGPLYQNISIKFINDTGIPLSFDGEIQLEKNEFNK